MNYSKFFTALFLIICCLSCTKKTADNNCWSERSGEYYLPELGLVYKVPFDIGRWAIANPNNLPPQIKFLGVDNSNEVIVSIITPCTAPSKIENLSPKNVEEMVLAFIIPSTPSNLIEFNPTIRRDEDKWLFQSNFSVIAEPDTIHSCNIGSFFNADNLIVGLVVTAPIKDKNNIDFDDLIPYTDALKQQLTNKTIIKINRSI